MSGPKYLQATIAEARRAPIDSRRYMTRDGYTKRSGAPSNLMVRLEGEKCFRRLMVWQFSNAGTHFLRVRGEALIVPEHTIPDATLVARPLLTAPEAAPPPVLPFVSVEFDADDDPFFVCTACGLRSFLLSREAGEASPIEGIACAHCGAPHDVEPL